MVPNVHVTLLENSRLKKRQLLVSVSVVVTSTHLFSHLAALRLEKCSKCKKEGHFAHTCEELSAEGSQVAAMERETPPNHDVHTYFGSAVLDTVFGTRKKFRSLITVKIAGKDVQTKQILVQKLPSSAMN